MSRRIPTSWEEDDWSHPASASNGSSNPHNPSSLGPSLATRPGPGPTLLRTGAATNVLYNPREPEIVLSSQQPRTLYKPELTILKRDTASQASGSREVKRGGSSTKEEREKERKEKERRYKEVKERIFAEGKAAGGGATTDGNGGNNGGNNGANGNGRGQGGKRGGRGGSGNSTPKSGARTPGHQSSPSPTPQPQPQSSNSCPNPGASDPSFSQPKVAASKPLSTGAITGFSLNSGTLSAPVKQKERSEWQLRQVELDGKMLESQAQQYGFGQNEELLGDMENGLDWDEFRRDQWGGERRGEGQGQSYAEGYGTTSSYDVRRFSELQSYGGGYGGDTRGDYTRGYVQGTRDYAAGGYARDIPQDAMEYAQKTQDLGDRFNKLDLIGFGESADPLDKPIPVSMGIVSRRDGAQVPIREPRGPDGAGGRGFSGRGRGRGGRAAGQLS